MKNKAYLLLISIAIAGTILFLDLYGLLANNAIKIIGLSFAGALLLMYVIMKYSAAAKEKKNHNNNRKK